MAKWLDNAIFYEIYPQTFCDTNGDGIGDIAGIISKLDYVKSLGCNAIWLNPIFDSPFMDAGYDVRNYKLVAERYGTNDDLIELFNKAHEKGIKIILDLVPGHTSDQCEWFIESQKPEKNGLSQRNGIHAGTGLQGDSGISGWRMQPGRCGLYLETGYQAFCQETADMVSQRE